MDKTLTKLGKKIACLRAKKKLTQENLAEIVGRSTNHISKLELGKCSPSFELLVAISNALGVDICELFVFDKTPPIKNIKNEFKKILETGDDKTITLLYKIYSLIV